MARFRLGNEMRKGTGKERRTGDARCVRKVLSHGSMYGKNAGSGTKRKEVDR